MFFSKIKLKYPNNKGRTIMIIQILIGVILSWLLIAYHHYILRSLPYIWPLIISGIAVYALRALPALAEPLAIGILAVLLCYIVYMILRYRGKVNLIREQIRKKEIQIPIIKIPDYPQLSILLTLTLYTLGVMFVFYVIILLIYVQ